jgi:hypothetical protein
MVATATGTPPFICTITADFLAFRSGSIVIRPVTPTKSLVSAIAFASAVPSHEGARCIASNRRRAESYPSAPRLSGFSRYSASYAWTNLTTSGRFSWYA